MNTQTKKIVFTALLSAIAFVSVFIIRIPFFNFLTFEPKDSIITLAGLISGPITSILVSVIVSFVEMVTISTTGPIGFIMNLIASLSFILPVTIMYKKNKTMKSIIVGLILSTLLMTFVMVLWNLLISPMYLGVTIQEVAGMLIPIFIPFNIIKGVLNSLLIVLFYKTIYSRVKKAKLIDTYKDKSSNKSVIILTTIIIIISLVLYFFVL